MRQDSSFFTQAGLAGDESPLHASNDASQERWHCCVQFAAKAGRVGGGRRGASARRGGGGST